MDDLELEIEAVQFMLESEDPENDKNDEDKSEPKAKGTQPDY